MRPDEKNSTYPLVSLHCLCAVWMLCKEHSSMSLRFLTSWLNNRGYDPGNSIVQAFRLAGIYRIAVLHCVYKWGPRDSDYPLSCCPSKQFHSFVGTFFWSSNRSERCRTAVTCSNASWNLSCVCDAYGCYCFLEMMNLMVMNVEVSVNKLSLRSISPRAGRTDHSILSQLDMVAFIIVIVPSILFAHLDVRLVAVWVYLSTEKPVPLGRLEILTSAL